MAHINNGHFGSFQGKIGAVTGVKRRGKFYIRQSITANRSNTKKQALQRAQFAAVSKVLSAFAPAVNIGFKHSVIPGMTAYNAAFEFNFDRVDKLTQELAPQNIVLSRGSLFNVANAKAIGSADSVKFTWTDNTDDSVGTAMDDVVFAVVFEPQLKKAIMATGARKDAAIDLHIPIEFAGHQLHAYIFSTTAIGDRNSDSAYLGSITCE